MKTEKIKELASLQERVNALRQDTRVEFIENIKQLFVDHPTLKSFNIRINNHEFNDGDPTDFSLYYDECEITTTDDEVIAREYSTKEEDSNPLVEAVYDVFSMYDQSDIHEVTFGHEHGYLEIHKNYKFE